MMDKLYAVWTGYYSDRTVQGVFSTEKRAQVFCDEYNKGRSNPDARFVIYDLDAEVDYKRLHYFSTCIMYDDGELCDRDDVFYDLDDDHKPTDRYISYHRSGATDMIEPSYIVVHSRESADHADKIAIEARQEVQRLIGQGMSIYDINRLWGNV